MDKYGSDKPDLRFGNPLVELTEYFKNTPFRVFQAPYVVPWSSRAVPPRRVVSSTLAGLGSSAWSQGPCLRGLRRKRRAQGPRRQEPIR